MDAEQPLGCLAAHRVRDGGAHVAALGDVARVAEAVHQLRPRACDAAGLPAELGRLAREAVAGQGRQHQVECVLGGAAVSGRVGQRADGLEQLDDRAGPAMRHDQRQRVLVPRPDVDEVDLDPVDLGRELRQRVQPRLARAPVVLGRPVAGELLHRRQLHALRAIGDELLGGPARRRDPAAQLGELLLRNLDWNGRIAVASVVTDIRRSFGSFSSPQRAEARAELGGEQLRLLPGGEVATSVDFVEVDEVRVGLLGPAARNCIK